MPSKGFNNNLDLILHKVIRDYEYYRYVLVEVLLVIYESETNI